MFWWVDIQEQQHSDPIDIGRKVHSTVDGATQQILARYPGGSNVIRGGLI